MEGCVSILINKALKVIGDLRSDSHSLLNTLFYTAIILFKFAHEALDHKLFRSHLPSHSGVEKREVNNVLRLPLLTLARCCETSLRCTLSYYSIGAKPTRLSADSKRFFPFSPVLHAYKGPYALTCPRAWHSLTREPAPPCLNCHSST